MDSIQGDKLSIFVLGVGGGADHVYKGICSSSLLLLKNEQPFCLIDLGLGVVKALSHYGFALPPNVVITHNHTDHSGELPVVLRVEHARENRLRVIAQEEVSSRLQSHRMAEHAQVCNIQELAVWDTAKEGERLYLDKDYYLRFYRAKHSELCFGFVVYRQSAEEDGLPLFAYSADSGFDKSFYDDISVAPLLILDARENGNDWHAGFDEVSALIDSEVFIIGHGIEQEDISNAQTQLSLLKPGQVLELSL